MYSGFQAGVARAYIRLTQGLYKAYISNWRGSQIQKGAKKSGKIKRKDRTRGLFNGRYVNLVKFAIFVSRE
jgi:hypothetical protein